MEVSRSKERSTALLVCSEHGNIYLIILILSTVLFSFAAMAIDASWGYNQRLKLQAALDAATLAGARRLGEPAADDPTLRAAVTQEVLDLANANGVSSTELLLANIEVGQWDIPNKRFEANRLPYNAVRAQGTRLYRTFLASLIGYGIMRLQASSIATTSGLGAATCLPPFAVDDDIVENLRSGDSFILSRQSPGNWGKINLRDDIHGESDFREAIRDGVCDVQISSGQIIDTETGYSGVDNGIDDRFQTNAEMILPIVENFPNGQSVSTRIVGFIKVEVVRTAGDGNNWEGEFVVREVNGGFVGGGTTDRPFIQTRVLVQ